MATIRAATKGKTPEELLELFAQICEETNHGAVFVVLRVDEPKWDNKTQPIQRVSPFLRVAWTFRADGDEWSSTTQRRKGVAKRFNRFWLFADLLFNVLFVCGRAGLLLCPIPWMVPKIGRNVWRYRKKGVSLRRPGNARETPGCLCDTLFLIGADGRFSPGIRFFLATNEKTPRKFCCITEKPYICAAIE